MSFVLYIESQLGEARWNSSETEASWCCPFCEKRGESEDTRYRFRFNVNKLVGVCYNCAWGGNAIDFIRELQGLSYGESLDILNFYAEYKPLPASVFDEVFDKIFLEGKEVNLNKKVVPLPKDFKLLHGTKALTSKPFIDYAKSRGLTDEQIELHGVGFCPEGEIKLENGKSFYLKERLIIQVFNEKGEPVYWMGRALRGNAKPKTFNPVGTANSYGKTDVVFNLNNARKHDVCVITEGVFDATTVGSNGVALFGKTMNVKQLVQILNAKFKRVYVMLDNDALKNAIDVCEMLSKHIPETFLCHIEENGGDPNGIGKVGCLNVLKQAEKYNHLTAAKYKLLYGGI